MAQRTRRLGVLIVLFVIDFEPFCAFSAWTDGGHVELGQIRFFCFLLSFFFSFIIFSFFLIFDKTRNKMCLIFWQAISRSFWLPYQLNIFDIKNSVIILERGICPLSITPLFCRLIHVSKSSLLRREDHSLVALFSLLVSPHSYPLGRCPSRMLH